MTSKIWPSIISAFFALFVFSGLCAQEDSVVARKRILRLSIDLATPTYSYFFDKARQRSGFEALAEYSLSNDLFLVAEAGFHQLHYVHANDSVSDAYQYAAHGTFVRLGVNRNLMKYYNEKDRDLFYIGGRLAGTVYDGAYSTIQIIDSYWGKQASFAVPLHYYFATWGELVAGMRIETLKNLFLGWDLRLGVKLYDSNNTAYKTLFIPGYGAGQSPVSVWLNYSIGYAF